MRRRKFLLGSTAFGLGGLGLLSGVGAYSQTEAKREVQIEIVGDEQAYLSLQDDHEDETDFLFGDPDPREAPVRFHIKNQTTEEVEVNISLEHGNFVFIEPQDSNFPKELNPGEKLSDIQVDLPTEGEETDTLVFDIEGQSTEIHADRTLTLEKIPDFAVEDITFQQNGNRVNFGTNIDKEVKVWYTDDSETPDVDSENVEVDDDDKVTHGDLNSNGVEAIIAVEIDNKDPVTNPGWKGDKYEKVTGGGNSVKGCVVDPDDVEDEFKDFLKDADKHPYCDGE